MILLIKLLVAHLLGDFFLQPGHWIREKEIKKWKSPLLYVHALLHGGLAYLFVWDLSFWRCALVIFLTHLLIDGAKATLQKKKHQWIWFLADQLLHIIVLISIWYGWEHLVLPWGLLSNENLWIMLTAVLLLTLPASVGIRILISDWAPATGAVTGDSLQNAGMFIGILERLFVFAFVILGQWSAIGFLLAAKSVFRFGDLKESKDRKLTEYVLIGTLLSFGLALLTGVVVAHVSNR